MTERRCKTCCWWQGGTEDDMYGECWLEPTIQLKRPDQFCRHHSFTTGWLEDDEKTEDR